MCDKKSRHVDNSSESFSAHLQRKSVFSISLTNVSFHGNFGHSFGHHPCPLGERCLPMLRTLLAPLGQACCPFPEVLLSFPMIVAWCRECGMDILVKKARIGICQIRLTYSDSVGWVMSMPSLLRQVAHSFAARSLSSREGRGGY